MTTRTRGPGAGFRWLSRGISVGFRHPKSLIPGAVILTLLMIVPVAIVLAMQWKTLIAHTQPDPTAMFKTMPISMLLYLLLVPVYAGYLQVINAAENGEAVRASDIFRPYRSSEALRLIGYGLVMFVLYIGVFALILATVGHGVVSWDLKLLSTKSVHPVMTTLPEHFGATFALLFVAGLYIFAVYGISLGQIAVGQRSVFGAIGDGLVGALRNVLPLIVLVLSGILASIVMMLGMLVLMLVIGLVGAFAGKWVVIALTFVVEIAMLFFIYMIQFGTQYYMWRDVCGDDIVTGTAETVAA